MITPGISHDAILHEDAMISLSLRPMIMTVIYHDMITPGIYHDGVLHHDYYILLLVSILLRVSTMSKYILLHHYYLCTGPWYVYYTYTYMYYVTTDAPAQIGVI